MLVRERVSNLYVTYVGKLPPMVEHLCKHRYVLPNISPIKFE